MNLSINRPCPSPNSLPTRDVFDLVAPRQGWIVLFLFSLLCFVGLSSAAQGQTSTIITPVGNDNVSPWYTERPYNMFNSQPTWNGSAPTGGAVGDGNAYIKAAWDNWQALVYIDFGPNWQNIRIQQCWTKYIPGRGDAADPYGTRWWGSATSTAQASGIAETQINFDLAAHSTAGAWTKDVDVTSTPITPKARYLILTGGVNRSDDACEYAFIGYVVSPTTVLSPFTSGSVIAGNLEGAPRMFDGQPTWNGTTPVSAPANGNNLFINAPWDGSKVAYIDFGIGWRTFRIQQCWTQYTVGRPSSGTAAGAPYAAAWWGSATSTAQSGGIAETQINFGTQTHDSSGAWIRDGLFSTAVTPKARYLMIQNGGNPTDHAAEYAFVGYYDLTGTNYAPEVNAGSPQSVQWTAHLLGTASDDRIPSPPSALTLTWSKVSGPAGGNVTFSAPNALATDVSASVPGTYQLKLTANDNGTTGLSGFGTVNITFGQATIIPTLPEVKAFNYSSLTLVEEINCGDPNDSHQASMQESPAGSSQYQTILGRACRVLPNPINAPSRFFAYRLGVGKNLQANKAYILVVEYPEDKSRETIIMNRGCETTRTFHTGITVGDALNGPYTPSNANSMHFGLSQQYRTAEMFFHLHSHFPGIINPRDDEAPRDNTPSGGFLVMIGHFSQNNAPLSEGTAVARIALYEAPALSSYTQPITLPPNNLPKRHLFWREEMADGLLGDRHGVDNDIDWYEWKAQMAKFLGMNTYSTDLLEFGYNQGFSSAKYNGFYGPGNKWEQIIYRFTQPQPAIGLPNGYGLDFMPYYEYAGSNVAGQGQMGPLKAARPLVGINSGHDYTGIWWCEGMDVDCTDAQTGVDAQGINHPYTDAQKLLDCTITSLTGSTGGRPIQLPMVNYARIANWEAGKWGYIDLGANYANLRITQAWTRSLGAVGGTATPEIGVYWSSVNTGFSGSTVAPGSIAETRINFITQPQSAEESYWTRDMNLTQANAITPPKRYLVLRAANTPYPSSVNQFLLVGWDASVSPVQIKTLPVAGAGSIDGHDLSLMFGEQAPFNPNPASFVGAWFRTRPSEIPTSFADAALARFATEANGGTAVTRSQLASNPTLMTSYFNWWLGKRKSFLVSLRDYLRSNVDPSAVVLFTWDATEEGAILVGGSGQIVADDPSVWTGSATTTDYQTSITNHLHLNSMLVGKGIFPSGSGQEEYTYSMPAPDPANYTTTDGVMMTHTFNKAYTASDATSWNQFRTAGGIAAIHHYCLNEDCMPTATGDIRALLGYFVTDADPAGPYVTLAETRSVAYGDPFYIGYLSSNSFSRLSPGYVRDFNSNFLALPAMTSTVVAGAANDSEVIVRKITTPSNGTWVAIANTSLNEKLAVQITPPVAGTVTNAVTGAVIPLTSGKIVLNMWPGKLTSVRIQ